jgi:hypothetical protein
MARNLHIYPKAVIGGSTWTYLVKVYDQDTRVNSRFTHSVAAGVTAEIPMTLLKVAFDLVVGDADTDQDVDDAMWLDTALGGPTNGETLWETWQALADPKISGLTTGYSQTDFWAEWTQQNTARVRSAARRILVNGRGWSIPWVHQHEGDGTNTDE